MIRQLIGLALLSALASAAAAQSPAKPAQPAPAAVKPDIVLQKWTGDLDGMIKRRRIRVLTTYSKTHFFIDKGQQLGITHDAFKEFEEVLNKKHKTGNMRVHVVFVPVSRDELGPALIDGRGDIAFASIVVTPERQKIVDFAAPTNTGVSEIVVTGPKSPKMAALDDLAGQEVYVRPGSIYHESLVRLNAAFQKRGKPPIILKPAPDNLEDEDLLEMLNAGLVKTIVVYSHLAEFWKQVFPNIVPRKDLTLEKGMEIAPAIRKNSPLLKAEIDAFVKNRLGTHRPRDGHLRQQHLQVLHHVQAGHRGVTGEEEGEGGLGGGSGSGGPGLRMRDSRLSARSVASALSAKYNYLMNAREIARTLGRRGGRMRARRLSVEDRKRIASLGGKARLNSLRAARRIADNLRYAATFLELRGQSPDVTRLRAFEGRLPGIYPAEP